MSHFGFAWRVCLAAHELSKKVNDKSTVCSCLQCKLPFVKVAVICMREERKRKREEGPWSVLSSSSFGFIITRTL